MLFLRAEEGQGLVEYSMILLFVALVVLLILVVLGPQVGELYSRVTSELCAL